MTLTDTGPLVAVLDRDDSRHAESVDAAKRLSAGALLTTWCCFREAMYLRGEVGGYRYQQSQGYSNQARGGKTSVNRGTRSSSNGQI